MAKKVEKVTLTKTKENMVEVELKDGTKIITHKLNVPALKKSGKLA